MTFPGRGAHPAVRLAAARATLADLAARIGTAGLAAAATRPGLAASVDQHAAALWDLLGEDEMPIAIGLAGYADGLRDMASGLGWHLPMPCSVDWDIAPWLVVRLVAVCQVAAALPAT
jgi:hypothetical protein